MLSIFKIILLFFVALAYILYCQMGLHEFLQMRLQKKVIWIAYTIIYLTALLMIFAEFIKD